MFEDDVPCPSCRAKIPPDAQFCGYCGVSISPAPPPPAPSPRRDRVILSVGPGSEEDEEYHWARRLFLAGGAVFVLSSPWTVWLWFCIASPRHDASLFTVLWGWGGQGLSAMLFAASVAGILARNALPRRQPVSMKPAVLGALFSGAMFLLLLAAGLKFASKMNWTIRN